MDTVPAPHAGPVEIGGYTRDLLRNPPPGPFFEKVAMDQARFAVVASLATPLVRIRDVSVARQGAAWTVRAAIVNEGYLDTSTEQARIARQAKPVVATLRGASGMTLQSPASVSHPFVRGTRGSAHVPVYHAEWTLAAPAGTTVTVEVVSEKGGTALRDVVLR